MALESLTWIVVANGLIQLAGLVYLARGQREIARIARAVAGLVYQEEEKTRTLLKDLLSQPHRPA